MTNKETIDIRVFQINSLLTALGYDYVVVLYRPDRDCEYTLLTHATRSVLRNMIVGISSGYVSKLRGPLDRVHISPNDGNPVIRITGIVMFKQFNEYLSMTGNCIGPEPTVDVVHQSVTATLSDYRGKKFVYLVNSGADVCVKVNSDAFLEVVASEAVSTVDGAPVRDMATLQSGVAIRMRSYKPHNRPLDARHGRDYTTQVFMFQTRKDADAFISGDTDIATTPTDMSYLINGSEYAKDKLIGYGDPSVICPVSATRRTTVIIDPEDVE